MRKNPTQHRPLQRQSVAAKQTTIENLAAQYRQAMAFGDLSTACQCCEKVLMMMPNNMTVLGDYALCLMRMGDYKKSYKIYQKIYQSPLRAQASDTWLDGLAEVCGWLNKADELRRFGHESLTLADEKFKHNLSYRYPASAPAPFDAAHPEKNIIAFSLYGGQPRYCETLIKNIDAAQTLYPAWTCRIYLDNSVPEHVWRRLKQPNVQLVDMSEEKQIFPTLWRFLVIDDPHVERFIVRDADSLLSEREVAAVEEWIDSPFWFHHMRDYFTHTDLLLAGMWGGCHGVLFHVEQLMRDFIASYQGNERYTDQQFLKAVFWPTLRESIMNHDDIFGFHHARPFPAHTPIRWNTEAFHVGSNAGYSTMAGPSICQDGELQSLDLIFNEQRYRYFAPVLKGEWSMAIPFFLADEYKLGLVRLELNPD